MTMKVGGCGDNGAILNEGVATYSGLEKNSISGTKTRLEKFL